MAPDPPLTVPAPGQELAPGRYTKAGFEPGVFFSVETGWTTVQQLPGFFDIQDDPGSLDVVAVQFTRAEGFDTAEDAVAAIQARAHLLVGEPRTFTVNSFGGGLTGIRLVVETTDPADADPVIFRPVLSAPPGPISIGSDRRLQVDLVTVNGVVLAIVVGGSIDKWDRAKRFSEPVLESIVIDDSSASIL